MLALELPDLLPCIGHLSLQLHDVVLKVVDGRLEAEGLLRAQGRVRGHCDGCTGQAHRIWLAIAETGTA